MLTNVFKIMSLLDYNNTILKENNLSKYLFNISNLRFLNYFKNTSLSIYSCSLNSNEIMLIDNELISILENNSDASLSPDNSSISKDSYLSNESFESFDSKISFASESKEVYVSDISIKYDYEEANSDELSDENSDNLDESILSRDSNILDYSKISEYSYDSENSLILDTKIYESFTNKSCNLDYIEYDSDSKFMELQSKKFHNKLPINNNESNNLIYYILKDDYDIFFNYLSKLDTIKMRNLQLYNKLKNRGLYLNLHIIQNGFFELLEIYENK